jgi:RND family efflux transporter MFP subunit
MTRESLLRYALPALAAGLLVFALLASTAHPEREPVQPTLAPARSPFDESVAGLGVVEPNSELVAIGTHLPGIIARVHVTVGQKVRRGDPLFTLDERDARARLAAALARLESARVAVADTAQQYARFRSLTDRRAASEDERDRRRFAAEAAEKALREVQAQVQVLQTELDRLTVQAPIDGTVLRVNARVGEFAPTGALPDPLLVLGHVEPLHVRVEVDETDAGRVIPNASAVARVRGSPQTASLAFVRAEPLLKPKRTLTGDGNERVDTRVLEVIYALGDSGFGARVGQQVDVFIRARPGRGAGL